MKAITCKECGALMDDSEWEVDDKPCPELDDLCAMCAFMRLLQLREAKKAGRP